MAASFFEDIPNGTYRLEIVADGYATVSSMITVKSFDNEENQNLLGDIGLGQSAQLSVIVNDNEGQPVNGGKVFVQASGHSSSARCAGKPARTLPTETTFHASVENGLATVTGLNQCELYNVWMPIT